MRAAGYGKNIGIAGFLKPRNSGEYKIISEKFPEAEIKFFGGENGFLPFMEPEIKEKVFREIKEGFSYFATKKYDLLVLDEILDVVNAGIISENELIEFLNENASEEIVITGRNPSEKISDKADYHTFFKKIKHPYDIGVSAREGIEF